MATIGSLTVNIAARVLGLEMGTKKAQKMLREFSRDARQSLETLGRHTQRLMIGAGAGIAGGLGLALKAFGEQQRMVAGLESTLQTLGQNVTANSQRFQTFAAEIQRTTTYGDEMILGLMTTGLNLGVTTEKIEQATRGALGLSQALGLDANTAMRYFALATQGEFTVLQRYIPALRQTTDASEKLSIVTDLAGRGFDQAKAQADTFVGNVTQLKNAFGDLLETIGGKFIEALGGIESGFSNIIEYVRAAAEWVKALDRAQIDNLVNWGKYLFAVGRVITLLPKILKLLDMLKWSYIKVAAAQALANPVKAAIGIGAALAVIGIGATLMSDTRKQFGGSFDKAMDKVRNKEMKFDNGGLTQADLDKLQLEALQRIEANTRKASEGEQRRLYG